MSWVICPHRAGAGAALEWADKQGGIPGGTNQTTQYVYGVGGTALTNLFSNDLIAKVEYPDPSTGAASTSAANEVSYTYHLLGDIVTMKDQNSTTHTYAFDLLGRKISDSIAVASGNPENIDTSIVKHATSYTDLGLPYQQTSYNSSSSVVNQIQYAYDGYGQETMDYEEHSGAVNTSTSPVYDHYYAEGVGNSDRLLAFGYNSGRIIDYVYGGQFAISSITHSGTTATLTTDTPHGLLIGTKVTISGASPSAYDGTFTITAITDATHFTYTTATTPGSNASGGAMLGTGTPQLPIASITHSGTTATITLDSSLLSGLTTGTTFSAQISGATPSAYDGTFTVTVASSTTLTYTTATTPSSNASGADMVMTSPTTTLDSAISRPDGIIDDTGTDIGHVLEGYSYLGTSTIVIRNRPEETTQLTYVQQTGDTLTSSDGGDEYTGLDRFGRIIDQNWLDYGTGSSLDRLQYGYDREGNVLYENNLLDSAYSQLYHANSATSGDNNTGYDALNRLIDFQTGTLSSSGNNGRTLDKITSPSQTQSFSLDGVGNWSDFNDSATSNQTASFNARNQYTGLSGGSSTSTPTYDNDGNMITDQVDLHYKYDAWNQLVTLKASNNSTVLLALVDNAMGQIVQYNDGTAGDWYYDGSQVISYKTNVWSQNVWGLGYTNDLILRDRDADNNPSTGGYGNSSDAEEERIYAQQDANWNVTSIYNLATSSVTERFIYNPYGKATVVNASTWASQSDSVDWFYRFQGARYESAGGFNIMGVRLQSVALGRWLQEDPSKYVDGANLYSSYRGGPETNTDPTGLVAIGHPFYTKEPTFKDGWDYNLNVRFASNQPLWVYQVVSGYTEYDVGSWAVGVLSYVGWDVQELDAGNNYTFNDHSNQGSDTRMILQQLNSLGIGITNLDGLTEFSLRVYSQPPTLTNSVTKKVAYLAVTMDPSTVS